MLCITKSYAKECLILFTLLNLPDRLIGLGELAENQIDRCRSGAVTPALGQRPGRPKHRSGGGQHAGPLGFDPRF